MASSFSGANKRELVDGIEVVRLGGIHSLWFRTFLYYMLHCRGRYDVVVTEGFGGSRIPRLAPLYARGPIITSWHQIHRDLFFAQYPRLLAGPLNLFERMTAWVHRDTWVQAYTYEWKEAFPSIGFKPEKVFVVPVSIRDEWLVESNGHKRAMDTILWIGKFRRYKCPDHAILAMAEIVKQLPGTHLVLIGRHDDLAYEGQLRKLVRDLGLEQNVDFRLDVSELEKRDLLEEASLLLLTSAVEGFGIVVLEANSCSVPVIASTGVPEGAVRDGVNGLRYKFGDTKILASTVVQVLKDDRLYSKLADNSLRTVREFAWSRVGPQFERVILEMLSESVR